MRVVLFLVLIYTPFCWGNFSWSAVMQKVFDSIQKLTAALSKNPVIKTKMYCRELAQFTPQICDNPVASQKCTDICGEDKNTPGKIFHLNWNFTVAAGINNITVGKY